MPDVPTISGAGAPNYEAETWYGISVPARTPNEIIARLHDVTTKALASPDAKERLDTMGYQARISTPEHYATFTRSEIDKWAKVVKAAKIRPD